MLALPIFPASHPASIVGEGVLNFCVRDGNRWTHTPINTNLYCASDLPSFYIVAHDLLKVKNYFLNLQNLNGDPYRIRTDVNGVRGRCLNHLTNGPHSCTTFQTPMAYEFEMVHLQGLEPGTY